MSFLQQNGLAHRAELLRRHGFDDMEAMLEMADSDLRDLGMPACDSVKLRRRLKQLQNTKQCHSDGHPVAVFLREIGLQQYAEELVKNGFDDLETLLELRESDMQDFGMLRGHVLKLSKRLRELRAETAPGPQQQPLRCSNRRPAEGPAEHVERFGSSPPSGNARGAVQASWERLQQLGIPTFGERLYKNVFKLAPGTVALFPPEVRHKYRDWTVDEQLADESDVRNSPALKKLFGKIVNAVGLSVAGMHEPTKIVPMLIQLGARHIGYGAQIEFWPVMWEAFNLTLQESLGKEYTTEVKVAWELVYNFISAIMIEGLKEAIAARDAAAAKLRKLGDIEEADDEDEKSPASGSTGSGTPSSADGAGVASQDSTGDRASA